MRGSGNTRERIKQQAMRLFVERGIDAVSVRDIADAVGMKPSNLYAHFRSREELVQELFAEGYAEYGRLLSDVPADGGFALQLRSMVHLICHLHDEDTTRFRFLLLSQHAAAHAAIATGENPMDVVQRAIASAMDAGEAPRGDPATLAAMIVGAVLQTATFRMYGRIGTDLGAVADELAGACLRLSGINASDSPKHHSAERVGVLPAK